MRLDDLDPSEHVRDLGGGGGGGGGGMGLLGLLPLLFGRGMGCGGMAMIAIVVVVYLTMSGGGGGLLSSGGAPGTQQGSGGATGAAACNTAERKFTCQVMTSTEQTWDAIFREQGRTYQPATLNFFKGGTQSGCGSASAATGPFYCPPDQGVYLDTTFFDELAGRFGAKGDFAQAYVIAHEIGHHVQNITGIAGEVTRQQQRVSRTEANRLSVKLELQADCYAGVWAARNKTRMEPGDLEEGLTAANAIGDDTLQREAQGTVVPDSFTHGTSEQRKTWLRKGLETGDPNACDTFGTMP